jgi:hypothetical protein
MQIQNAIITGSFSYNGADLSNVTSSNAYSASLSSRTTDLESTSSVLVGASASFSSILSSVSSSQQQISASLLNVIAIGATTGSNSFRADQSITGSLTVTGQIIAQSINVQQVTSSIIYSSGSNVFGCDLNSRQTFTGSVNITGSTTLNGALTGTSAAFACQVCASLVVTNTVSTGGTALTPTAACLGYGIFGYSGVGLGIASSANGPNQGMGFFVCGDVERMRIITSGNVGIGTVCPSYLLDVNGTGRFGQNVNITSTTGNSAFLKLNRFLNTNSSNILFSTNDTDDWFMGTNSIGTNLTDFYFYRYGIGNVLSLSACTGAATFSSNTTVCGVLNVGGATNTYSVIQRPTAPAGSQGIILTAGAGKTEGGSGITFSDNACSGGTIWLSGNSSDIYGGGVNLIAYGQTAAANIISFATRSGNGTTTERMQITSAGNVIVGNPAYAGTTTDLSITGDRVNGDGYYSRLIFQNSNQSGGSSASIRGERTLSNFATELTFYTNINTGAGSGSERMRIRYDGVVLIGQTTTSLASGGTQFVPNGETYHSIVNSLNTLHVYDRTNSVYRFYVGGNGTVNATNTTISAISDVRLKENIVDLEIGLDAIMTLRPRQFDWKKESGNSGKNIRGFIAQEFEQTFPDLIDESINPAPEGEEPYKQIRQDLIPILVKGMQEQQCTICSQATMINTLKTCLGIA